MSKAELKWAALCAAGIMALTAVPYLIGWWYTPLHSYYPWLLFNADDHAVYYAWIRQSADGHFLFRNLFTVDPQRGVYFHLYFLILGWLARLPFLGVEGADQVGRLACGTGVLILVYRLAAFFTPEVFTRRVIFWTTALSAGFGWLMWHDHIRPGEPVDTWQPEAFTFASLYTNGLFCVALLLMLGVVVCLLLAEERGWKWALGAGACGFALANIHTYDLFHLTAVWSTYLLLRGILTRKFPWDQLRPALIAAAVTAPSFAYMYWFFKTEPVFKERVEVPTLSPPFFFYLLGYGLLIPLAICGAVLLVRRVKEDRENYRYPLQVLLPLAWCVAGMAVAYAPVAFQRKMVMGLHFPLSLLAGFAISALATAAATRVGKPRLAPVAAGLAISVLSPSMLRYLVRDVRVGLTENLTSTGIHPVYWDETQIHAFQWLHDHSPARSALMTFPHNGLLAPAYSGRAVWSGHWGETPRYNESFRYAVPFYWGLMTRENRLRFLQVARVQYVLDSRHDRELTEMSIRQRLQNPPPMRPLSTEPYLKPVFQEGETILYEVAPAL